jgi:DNA invertase Pin-like site-specific DNA recombinase
VLTAAIYLRQSLDRSGERQAVERQLEACLALCRAKGWEVHGQPYEDNDTSATSLKPRPAYRRLLADAKAGHFDAIVVWHIDRLARRLRDLEDVIDIGLPIATATGDMDLSTDVGRLLARILGAVAQGEAERKAARQRFGNRQRAVKGIPHASPRPFGYRWQAERDDRDRVVARQLVVQPSEATAVSAAYSTLLAGGALRSIAKDWNAAGHVTSKGKPWAAYSVRDRLLSPLYAGVSIYNGEEVGEGSWEAIVPEETWRAAVALLQQPDRRTTPGNARKYMLAGLARCGVDGCGALMATGRTQRGKRTYQCSKARHLSRDAEPIDQLVREVVVARLNRPDARDLLHDESRPDATALRREAQTLRARQDELALMLAEGALNRRQFELANVRVVNDLAAVEGRMQVSARAEALRDIVGGDAAAVWEALDVDRRRAAVSALMTVTLRPPGRGRRTFDPTTVAVEWQAG